MTAVIELTARKRLGIVDWWQFEDYAIIQYENTQNITMEPAGLALVSEKRELTATAAKRTFTLYAEQANDETFSG